LQTLNYFVTYLLGGHHHHHALPEEGNKRTHSVSRSSDAQQPDDDPHQPQQPAQMSISCPCCSDDPVGDLEKVRNMAQEMQAVQDDEANAHNKQVTEEQVDEAQDNEFTHSQSGANKDVDAEAHEHKEVAGDADLMRMSINTAVAIGLHNFPEGLATFVAALNDPKVGTVLAIAIAIHNIPEGLCVAMPVYYATGNRWKAFGWAVFSGLSEPLAAVLGWAVLANSFSDLLYGILFGMIAGMMVVISTRELLPTAHRYDPEDTVVTYSFIVGMGVMALSLVLFIV
jgi:zinc transporter ZupT